MRLLISAGIIVSVLALLLAPIGFGSTLFARAAENSLHAPLFALVAVALLFCLRQYNAAASSFRSKGLSQYVLALSLAVALGAVGEIAQSFTASRHAEWIDLANDFLGAAAGLSVFALYDRRQELRAATRRVLWVAVTVSLIVVAAPLVNLGAAYWQRWQQLPELATWHSSAGYRFVTPVNANIRVAAPSPQNGVGAEAVLQVSPLTDGRWAGVSIDEPWPDWSTYSQLVVELVNTNSKPLTMWLRVHDRPHNNEYTDRFNRQFEIAAHTRATLSVPLADVRSAPASRQLDLQHVAGLILFQDAERGAQTMYVYGVRLVR